MVWRVSECVVVFLWGGSEERKKKEKKEEEEDKAQIWTMYETCMNLCKTVVNAESSEKRICKEVGNMWHIITPT